MRAPPRDVHAGLPAFIPRLLLRLLTCLLAAAFCWAPALARAEPDLDSIEQTLRGQPEATVAALGSLIPTLHGPELLEALIWRGEMQDRMQDEVGLEATAVRLDTLARGGQLAGAPAAAALLRALPVVRRGPLGRADRLLGEAIEQLPGDIPDRIRFEFLYARASTKQLIGRFDEAVAVAQQCVLLADRIGTPWRRSLARVELGYSLWRAQQADSALAADDLALQIARNADDPLAESQALTLRAQLMSDRGRDDEDVKATRAAIELARKAGATRGVVLGLANLADHYLRIGDNATALSLAREALPLAREVRDTSVESLALSNGGFALILLGQHEQGLAMVRQSLAIEERAGALSYMADIQQELGSTLEKVGRLREAWAALREFRRLSDESFRRDRQQAVLELEESFEAERRKGELSALKIANNLKEAELLGHELQRRVWAVTLSAGLLTLVLVGVLVRRMRHSNAQLQTTNALLKVASESDPLTGLANRRHLLVTMAQADRAEAGFEGALILIDLDHFKQINDRHGHAGGDAVLIEIAARLRRTLREEDLAVRWGGEEFLVVVRALPLEQVEALAQRLLAAIGDTPVAYAGARIPVTASIGFATFPLSPWRHPLSWERAIDLVDTAMYLAKAHGRNRAYGVRSLEPDEAGGAPPAAAALERAWRGGRADLAQFAGPAVNLPPP